MGSQASAYLAAASASWSGGDASAALAELWIREALTALYPDLAMINIPKFGGPGAWKQIPVHKGKKLHFHRLPVLAADTTELTAELDDPAATTGTLVGVTAQVKAYAAFTIIGDESDDYTLRGAYEDVKEMLAYKMLRTQDALIYADIHGTAATTACVENGGTCVSTVVTGETTHGLTLENLEYIAYLLKTANVRTYVDGPMRGRYFYAAHPRTIKTVRAVTGTREYADLAKNIGGAPGMEALAGMHVGNLCGFSIFETTEIVTGTVSAATSASVYKNIAAGYESYGITSLAGNATPAPKVGTGKLIGQPRKKFRTNVDLIVKRIGSSGTADPLNRRGSVGYKFRIAHTVLDANRLKTHMPYGGIAGV